MVSLSSLLSSSLERAVASIEGPSSAVAGAGACERLAWEAPIIEENTYVGLLDEPPSALRVARELALAEGCYCSGH